MSSFVFLGLFSLLSSDLCKRGKPWLLCCLLQFLERRKKKDRDEGVIHKRQVAYVVVQLYSAYQSFLDASAENLLHENCSFLGFYSLYCILIEPFKSNPLT